MFRRWTVEPTCCTFLFIELAVKSKTRADEAARPYGGRFVVPGTRRRPVVTSTSDYFHARKNLQYQRHGCSRPQSCSGRGVWFFTVMSPVSTTAYFQILDFVSVFWRNSIENVCTISFGDMVGQGMHKLCKNLGTTSKFCGPGGLIGIATGYGLDGPGIESRWGARFSAPVQTGLGAHPAFQTRKSHNNEHSNFIHLGKVGE